MSALRAASRNGNGRGTGPGCGRDLVADLQGGPGGVGGGDADDVRAFRQFQRLRGVGQRLVQRLGRFGDVRAGRDGDLDAARDRPARLVADLADVAVRKDVELAVVVANLGRPHRQVLDDPGHAVDRHVLADRVLILEQNDEPGDDVLGDLLRAKAERDPGDARRPDDAGRVEPDDRQSRQREEDTDSVADDTRHQAREGPQTCRPTAPARRRFLIGDPVRPGPHHGANNALDDHEADQ